MCWHSVPCTLHNTLSALYTSIAKQARYVSWLSKQPRVAIQKMNFAPRGQGNGACNGGQGDGGCTGSVHVDEGPDFDPFWQQNRPFQMHFGSFLGHSRTSSDCSVLKSTSFTLLGGICSVLEESSVDPVLTPT